MLRQWIVCHLVLTVLASVAERPAYDYLHNVTAFHNLVPRDKYASNPRPWILALTSNDSRPAPSLGQSPTCYDYPDSSKTSVLTSYPYSSSVNLSCWTHQPRYRKYTDCTTRCSPSYEAIWFRTTENCWLPDWDVSLPATGAALARQLSDLLIYCPAALRESNQFRPQYADMTYCYSCPSLGCAAQGFSGSNGGADLQCWRKGEVVRGDSAWWKVRSGGLGNKECWLPNQVFDPFYFNGNAHECGL